MDEDDSGCRRVVGKHFGILSYTERALAEAGAGSDPQWALVVFTNGAEMRATQGVPDFLARFELSDEIQLSDLTPTPGAHPTDAVEAPGQFLDLFGEFVTSRLWPNLTMTVVGPHPRAGWGRHILGGAGVEPDLVW